MISVEQKEIIITTLKPFQPKKIGVFGSYARGENTEGSDLDLLVEFGAKLSLLDLAGLEQDLTEHLRIKVGLVTQGGLSPYIRPYVEKDYKAILP
ncbi:MAG TPA: nucleotidyltransferase family protein [Cyclobacteriaceae bacterium]|jgi:predicted nucleotidyltransferase|nr:nucleotidyltransferase family protein [Cyclobacteriaceae bacterium]